LALLKVVRMKRSVILTVLGVGLLLGTRFAGAARTSSARVRLDGETQSYRRSDRFRELLGERGRHIKTERRLAATALLRSLPGQPYASERYVMATEALASARPAGLSRAVRDRFRQAMTTSYIATLRGSLRDIQGRDPRRIAAYRTDRAKERKELLRHASADQPWTRSLRPEVAAAQQAVREFVNSPAFDQYVSEGAVR
jgi:hypothetical protein